MNTSGIPPIQLDTTMSYGKTGSTSLRPPPLPAPSEEGDRVQLSPEAMQKLLSDLPDAITAAVSDLQGEQATMSADFRTIGDYFVDHGGREALDAFMRSNFSEAQLRAFPPPTEGARSDPPPQRLPDSVTSAVADLQGGQATMGADFKTLGDYFQDHGGREALRAFMKATFTEDQREAFRTWRQASEASTSTT